MVSVFHSTGDFVLNPIPSVKIDGLSAYSHQTNSIGGFISASIQFNTDELTAEDWIFNGVGRHVKSFSHLGNVVWSGVVNSVSRSIGPRSITVGNYLDIVNKVKVAYTLRNPPVGTPDADKYLETDWAEDTDSSSRYGSLEQLMSGGSGYSQEMDTLRDQTLKDNLEPRISESLSTGQGAPSMSVTLACIGYIRLFERQTYTYGTTTEYDDLSVKITDIINANANIEYFLLNRDIQHVGLDVLLHETQRRTGWGIMKDDISKAANSGEDIVCGMFTDNTFVLDLISNRSKYSRVGGSSVIIDASNNPIPNSEVMPGNLMRNNDMTIPIEYPILSVSYNLQGDSIQINEASRSIKTVLSRTMLGGIY